MKTIMRVALWKKILAAIIIGLGIGFISPSTAEIISPLGDIFLRMLKMLIVPLVFFSITSGICKMGDLKQLRSVGSRFVLYVVITSSLAAFLGVIIGIITNVGTGTTEFLEKTIAAKGVSYSFIDNVVSWFPTNIVDAMSNANMLQIIVFCLFLGVALLSLGEKAANVIKFIEEGSNVMLKITEYIMEYSPIGILSLMATLVSKVSGAMMMDVIQFLIVDNLIALFMLVIVYPLMIKLFVKLDPLTFMKKISPAMLVAITTTSSAATLPVSIKCSEEKLGVPENIYGFTLPLGNTCGMNGFAIFIGLCCIFASNLYGFEITIAGIIKFVFLGLILSIGAAGVKGAGIVMSTVLLEALGMPLTLIPILAAIWPAIDPAHTVINNVSDLTGTTLVAKNLKKLKLETFEQ